jgi:hypothetical protein
VAKPFKPDYTCKADLFKGAKNVPPYEEVFKGKSCAVWFSSGRSRVVPQYVGPPIVAQAAFDVADIFAPQGWVGGYERWDWDIAWWLVVSTAGGQFLQSYQPVHYGPMWIGTSAEHLRYDLGLPPLPTGHGPQAVLFDQLDSALQGRETTCDIYRPFGATTLVAGNVPCYVYPGTRGQVASNFAFNFPDFDTVLIVGNDVDVRDGNTRTVDVDGAQFTDGDEIHIPSGSGNTSFVVVRVERSTIASGQPAKRVFALRHHAVWPGP